MVKELKYTNTDAFVGSIIIDSHNITYQETEEAINATDPNSTQQTYQILEDTYNSELDEYGVVRASYVLFSLETDPYSLDGIDWLVDCRVLLKKREERK